MNEWFSRTRGKCKISSGHDRNSKHTHITCSHLKSASQQSNDYEFLRFYNSFHLK